jgi:hypothetical protein
MSKCAHLDLGLPALLFIMNPSETHLRVNERFEANGIDIIKNPEILGPNWQTVLHFWKYADSLTKAQWETVGKRYPEVGASMEYYRLIGELTEQIVNNDCYYAIWGAGVGSINKFSGDYVFCAACAAKRATFDLICMHEVLDAGHKLMHIPVFHDL